MLMAAASRNLLIALGQRRFRLEAEAAFAPGKVKPNGESAGSSGVLVLDANYKLIGAVFERERPDPRWFRNGGLAKT